MAEFADDLTESQEELVKLLIVESGLRREPLGVWGTWASAVWNDYSLLTVAEQRRLEEVVQAMMRRSRERRRDGFG
jgi:hypothetical protein